ncbi:hypothetical protein EMCRGX_G005177 [Ephydatia muelleri]
MASSIDVRGLVPRPSCKLPIRMQRTRDVIGNVIGNQVKSWDIPLVVRISIKLSERKRCIHYSSNSECVGSSVIVVSPLKALMKDQVTALISKGVSAAYLNSDVDYRVQRDNVLRGELTRSTVLPNGVTTSDRNLKTFGAVRSLIPSHVHIMAMTATTTTTTRYNVITTLGLIDPVII